jgi:nucleoside-diphosphate-sugar epimerase
MALTLAITGGTGFVGGHALAAATAAGHRVRALARRPAAARPGVEWVTGSLTDGAALDRLVAGADALIHIAGVTNARNAAGFLEGNVLGTAFLRRAAGALPLVHVSSLSAREPQLSIYGASKKQGEDVARGGRGPFAIVRPPAVYGPGDRDFLALFQAARAGVMAVPKGARAAMLYGPDLGEALLALALDLAGEGKSAGRLYEIDDGAGSHPQPAIASAIGTAVGTRPRVVEVPGALLGAGALLDTGWSRLRGRLPTLSLDRARYLAHPDWSADGQAFAALGLWRPRTDLATGLRATADWYRAQGLLP